MDYSAQLKSPLWQKKRLKVMERDNWKCQKCGSTVITLNVHHIDYIPGIKAFEYPDDMLQTLCENCHAAEKQRPKWETDLLTSLKMNGFLAYDVWHLATKLYTDERFREHIKAILRK